MSGETVINLRNPAPEEAVGGGAVSQLISRTTSPQGAYSGLFSSETKNAIMPGLFEALREAIPMLDTAINNFNMLDGTPVVVGEDKRIVEALTHFFEDVRVGDNLHGMPSYVACYRDEVHEQGFSKPEHLLGQKGIAQLNVPDSKALHAARKEDGSLAWYFDPFQKTRISIRPNATEQVAQILQHRTPVNISATFLAKKGFIELNPNQMHYIAYRVENSDAYGVSLLRSMPVFAETFLTIMNAINNTWQRFGDPSYHIAYESGKSLGEQRDANGDTPLEARQKSLAAGLKSAVHSKRQGHSSDFSTAVDRDSKVSITILGAEGMVLDAAVPVTKVVEQLTSGTGQPAWMLGVNTGTTQGMSKHQSEVLQQGSANRTNREILHIERLCKIHLRSLGLTWSDELVALDDAFSMGKTRHVRKAWRVEFNKPNLSDIVAKAQANFMNTQSDILRDRTGTVPENANAPITITTEADSGEKTSTTHNVLPAHQQPTHKATQHPHNHAHNHAHSHGQPLTSLETRPIANPALDKIETDALQGIHAAWQETTLYIVRALGLESANAQNAMTTTGFTFTAADKAMLADEVAGFVADIMENEGLAQGALATAYYRAWALGVIDGYTRTGLSEPSGTLSNADVVAEILKTSKTDFTKFAENKLLPRVQRVLEAGVEAGENPINIAANLKREMGGATWKWGQIARSETAMAWDTAKRGEWDAELSDGLIDDTFEWIPAPDACPICMALTTGNPYTLKTLPRVVVDTHPSDRCDTAPILSENP